MIEISKQQLKKSRRKSKMMSEFLKEMPSLTQSLARSKTFGVSSGESRPSRSSAHKLTFEDNQEDICLASMTSKIDMLDKKIGETTVTLTGLRRKSLDLLTKGRDPGDSDENGNKMSFIGVEKEIDRLQEYKNKLVDEREQIIMELHSGLIDKFMSTPLIHSPISRNDPRIIRSQSQISVPAKHHDYTLERDSKVISRPDAEMPSNFVPSSSFSPVSNMSPRVAEV